VRASDLYGAHKAAVEDHVRSSGLHWVILRLAGVMSVDPGAMPFSLDALFFESALPTDGRMHSIEVRDAAAAFAAATTADVVGEILLIGGDQSHLLRQGDVGRALAAARGLINVLPARPLRRPVGRHPNRAGRTASRPRGARAGVLSSVAQLAFRSNGWAS
jgi:uncharacterized protein YbjT (DUF2867 family)